MLHSQELIIKELWLKKLDSFLFLYRKKGGAIVLSFKSYNKRA